MMVRASLSSARYPVVMAGLSWTVSPVSSSLPRLLGRTQMGWNEKPLRHVGEQLFLGAGKLGAKLAEIRPEWDFSVHRLETAGTVALCHLLEDNAFLRGLERKLKEADAIVETANAAGMSSEPMAEVAEVAEEELEEEPEEEPVES